MENFADKKIMELIPSDPLGLGNSPSSNDCKSVITLC